MVSFSMLVLCGRKGGLVSSAKELWYECGECKYLFDADESTCPVGRLCEGTNLGVLYLSLPEAFRRAGPGRILTKGPRRFDELLREYKEKLV